MPNQLPHLILPIDQIRSLPFTSKKGGGGDKRIPSRNRQEHADKLKIELTNIQNNHSRTELFSIKFSGQPNMDLLCEEFDKKGYKMELLSTKKVGDEIIANVRIDANKTFDKLIKAFDNYVNPPLRGGNQVKNPSPYIASIEHINEISLKDLFTDDDSLFPNDDSKHWWEIWITNKDENALNCFKQIARQNSIIFNEHPLIFQDRTVFLVNATNLELTSFVSKCYLIAEVRIAKKLKSFVINASPEEQQKFLDDLREKIQYASESNNTRIVVLDGNIIKRHPLLDNALIRNQQALTVFSLDNQNEHATEMASLSLFGDIQEACKKQRIEIHHKVEGVQVFDVEHDDSDLYGIITERALQITSDNEQSAYIMPITETMSDKYKGKPSSWSAYLDNIVFNNKKLFAVSVGNINDIYPKSEYNNIQENSCIESPAQAWNVISVGSYTNLCNADLCSAEGAIPYANSGELSPYSRTSCMFSSSWPIKPDILLEGGNKVIHRDQYVYQHDSFELVACAKNFNEQLFTTISATSASTGISGSFIGELMATYPSFWPETIRGLLVHSAEWSQAMWDKLGYDKSKTTISNFSRMFGYGIPDLEKAKYSVASALTLIAQKDNFQVFMPKTDDVSSKAKIDNLSSILFIKLPWPKETLQGTLSNQRIKLTITLSYFIEPNPSERGYISKYAYQSHNLRFDLQRPTETLKQFESRVNNLIKDAENSNSTSSTGGYNWVLGPNSRTRGSVHKDILELTGAELAQAENIAVYSVAGWWKKAKLASDTFSRFSLIVSIDAGETDINLYNEIKNQIQIPVLLRNGL